MNFGWLEHWMLSISEWVGRIAPNSIYAHVGNVQALAALCMVSVVCGAVGSLVVGNRMAFFSDALAHCAFAGVGLGLLIGLLSGAGSVWFETWLTPIMVLFGIAIGLGIAFVREWTSQSADTIIGVFFAGAIGLGAVFLKAAATRRYVQPEDFLFGNPATLDAASVFELFALAVLVLIVLCFIYNQLVFASFNASLARSRNIRVRTLSVVFIILLALIVNVCLKTVGVLLINALLVVPAAAAANVCRNLRQLFPCAVVLCLFSSVVGQNASWEIGQATRGQFVPGESGAIVLTSVILFFVSMIVGPVLKNRGESRRLLRGAKNPA